MRQINFCKGHDQAYSGRAIGLALILLSLSVLFLDHFSEERAETYHRHIVSALA